MTRTAAALALALGLAAAAVPAAAATYKGRSVDERRYTGSVHSDLVGTLQGVQIRFNGPMIFVGATGQLVLEMRDEVITDPREIEAYDHRRGILWVVEVIDIETGKR